MKPVAIEDITRVEWIQYNWINVQEMQDENPKYIKGGLRPIENRKEAAEQFDALSVDLRKVQP